MIKKKLSKIFKKTAKIATFTGILVFFLDKKDTEKILLKYNYILLPTTPNLPFMLGEKKPNLVQRYYEDVFTVQANLSGHPAISFPLKASHKFLGSAQLIGKYFTEKDMLNTATQLSQY